MRLENAEMLRLRGIRALGTGRSRNSGCSTGSAIVESEFDAKIAARNAAH